MIIYVLDDKLFNNIEFVLITENIFIFIIIKIVFSPVLLDHQIHV